jgi:hypothetical protein
VVSHPQLRVGVRDRRIASVLGDPFDFAESAAHFDAHVRIDRFLPSSQILKEIAGIEADTRLSLAALNGARPCKERSVDARRASFHGLEFADASSATARAVKQPKFAPSDWIVCFGAGGRLRRPGVNVR